MYNNTRTGAAQKGVLIKQLQDWKNSHNETSLQLLFNQGFPCFFNAQTSISNIITAVCFLKTLTRGHET